MLKRPQPILALDLRSLALTRAGLGLLLLIDAVCRFGTAGLLYSDNGLMPRSGVMELVEPTRLSLHLINGGNGFIHTLLLLQLLAAGALMLGWRTRMATLCLFVLSLSLAVRNPLALSAADALTISLLWWGLFLPWNARWSVESALTADPIDDEHIASAASAGLIWSVIGAFVWLAASLDWSAPSELARAAAALLDQANIAYPWSAWISVVPTLDVMLAWWALASVALAPIMALIPLKWLRAPAIVNLLLFLAFVITHFALGSLPWMLAVGLFGLIGGGFWRWCARRHHRATGDGVLRIFYDGDCRFCHQSCLLLREFLIVPAAEIRPAQDNGRAHALMQAQYSWVVIDRQDNAHLKWDAFVCLLRESSLLRPLSGFFGLRRWRSPGTRVYDWVAEHRGAFGRVSARLLPRNPGLTLNPQGVRTIAGISLLFVGLWELSAGTLPSVARLVQTPVQLLGLDYRRDRLITLPEYRDGWFLAVGETHDGEPIDVLSANRGRPRYEPRRWPSLQGISTREQAYRQRLIEPEHQHLRQYWVSDLCRRHPEVQNIRLLVLMERDAPGAAVEQTVLHRQNCTKSK